MSVLAEADLRLDAGPIDYALLVVYFVVVLGIGVMARRSVSSSLDFLLSGRSLPAWVTGLAFISANLGALELMGMTANGAQYGMATVHYYWIGAIPAMVFLGLVMMPFYYGSKVRSVPEFMRRRFGKPAHLVNAISFAVAQILIAGINLFALAVIIDALLGWPLPVSILRRGAGGARVHDARWPECRHLQRGAAVLRHRGRAGAADDRRPDQGRRLAGHRRQDQRTRSSCPRGPRQNSPASTARCGVSSGWCSVSASCCRSATGRRTSPRCSAR